MNQGIFIRKYPDVTTQIVINYLNIWIIQIPVSALMHGFTNYFKSLFLKQHGFSLRQSNLVSEHAINYRIVYLICQSLVSI